VRYVGTGKIEGGHLHAFHKREMTEALLTWKDCLVTITIERLHATRSKLQNDYYWGVVIPRLCETFRKRKLPQGNDPDLMHESLKAQFMDPELVRTGLLRGFISEGGLTLGTSTTQLSKLQFMDYLERIVDHAALHWDTYIPPPDPLWREHAEAELSVEPEPNGDAA
jgi:hypothetical protein